MDDILFKKCELEKLTEFKALIVELESVFKQILSDNQTANNRYLSTLNKNIQTKDHELRKLKAEAWDYVLEHNGSVLIDIENNENDIKITLDEEINKQLSTAKADMATYQKEQDDLIHGCDELYNLLDELSTFLGKDDKAVKNTKTLITIPNVCKIDKKNPIWNKNTNEIKMNLKSLFESLTTLINDNMKILEGDLIDLKATEFDKLNI